MDKNKLELMQKRYRPWSGKNKKKQLKWCKSFIRVMNLRSYNKKKRVRKKNNRRVYKMLYYAMSIWNGIPNP